MEEAQREEVDEEVGAEVGGVRLVDDVQHPIVGLVERERRAHTTMIVMKWIAVLLLLVRIWIWVHYLLVALIWQMLFLIGAFLVVIDQHHWMWWGPITAG
jgi:hypothetical protein